MTIEDAKVIGFGTLALLVIFLSAQAIYSSRASIVAFLSGEWARSLEKARAQKAAREHIYGYTAVNSYQDGDLTNGRIMSRQSDGRAQTDAADADGRRVSAANPLWRDFLVDKTRARLIAVMVDSGMTVPEIRALIKGENGAIGAEVEAARQRLGIQPPAPYVTPIVGRPTSARFESDPDFPYQAPA